MNGIAGLSQAVLNHQLPVMLPLFGFFEESEVSTGLHGLLIRGTLSGCCRLLSQIFLNLSMVPFLFCGRYRLERYLKAIELFNDFV